MLPEHRVSTHPGVMLKEEFLVPMSITQSALADALGVSHHVISELVHGRRALSARMCAMLAKALGTSVELWAGLQADHDLSVYLQSERGRAEVKAVKPLVA